MVSLAELPPDLELLSRLARVIHEDRPPPGGVSSAELERAVETAHAHNALGVLLPALRRGGLLLPEPLEARLAAAEPALLAQALFRESGLEEVLRVLARADVEVAVLKGAFLASCVYGDFAERTMNDFDLFVQGQDLSRAGHALQEAGYALEDPRLGEEPGGAAHFKSPAGQAVELRHDLTQGTRLRGVVDFPEADMWRRRRIFTTSSEGTLCSLDPTDHLLYLAYHAGMLHLFAALIWSLDIDRFVRKFQAEVAWDDLPPRARQIGCATCLWHGLGLAKQLFGTPVGDLVLQALQPGSLRARLVRQGLTPRRLLRGMVPPQPLRMQALQMLLLDSIAADARSLWQGLLPPRQWLEWRYRTSNPLALLLLRTVYPFGGWARRRT